MSQSVNYNKQFVKDMTAESKRFAANTPIDKLHEDVDDDFIKNTDNLPKCKKVYFYGDSAKTGCHDLDLAEMNDIINIIEEINHSISSNDLYERNCQKDKEN